MSPALVDWMQAFRRIQAAAATAAAQPPEAQVTTLLHGIITDAHTALSNPPPELQLLMAAQQMRDTMNAPGFKSRHPDGQPFAVADAYTGLCRAISAAEGLA